MEIKNKPATRHLKHALKKWAKSKAAIRVHQLDERFLKSPDGRRLIKEWQDVGRVLEKNIKHTKNGLHFPNKKMQKLSKELDDVSDHYEYLGTTHWSGKYNLAYKNLFTNKEFRGVKKAGHKFKMSPAGRALHKEVKEFG